MTIKRKNKRHLKIRTRDLIVDEAEKLIAKHGLDGLKLDDIANILGIQRPSLYTHFDGRDGILGALVERAFTQLSQQFPDDDTRDPSDVLSDGVDQLVDFFKQHPAFHRLQMRDAATPGGIKAINDVLGPPDRVKVPPLVKPMFDRLQGILDRGVRTGEFRKMDAFFFFNCMMGAIMVNLTNPRRQVKNLNVKMVDVARGVVAAR